MKKIIQISKIEMHVIETYQSPTKNIDSTNLLKEISDACYRNLWKEISLYNETTMQIKP